MGGSLFRPCRSAPTIGPAGGPEAARRQLQLRQYQQRARMAREGIGGLVVPPRLETERSRPWCLGNARGTTFGPPPGRSLRSRVTVETTSLTQTAFNAYNLPAPALYKKNTTANASGSNIGLWSIGPGAGKRTPPRCRPTSASQLTRSACEARTLSLETASHSCPCVSCALAHGLYAPAWPMHSLCTTMRDACAMRVRWPMRACDACY